MPFTLLRSVDLIKAGFPKLKMTAINQLPMGTNSKLALQFTDGRVTLDFWKTYPWTLGSYSYWKVGQYTSFSGVEKEAVGSCHFAGEPPPTRSSPH